MAVREVQLFDNAVQTRTIAPDVVVPADIDETAAYNYSSASGTFAGVLTILQSGVVNDLGTSSTLRSFPTAFSGVPHITAQIIGESASSFAPTVKAVSASSFNLYADAAGTAHWIAHYHI